MAGELAALMSDAARQVTVLNAMALEHIADAFATPEEATVFSATFDEMAEIFAAHGHGADLYDCTDPFCMEAKIAIIESVQQIMNPPQQQQPPQGMPPQGFAPQPPMMG
ncbi:MAG: hypothetical protein CL707_07955 [Chloroflexi bacterium]|jgi:predicted outer membrane lipoprotein|nr:hypothetical protein [Chloroflexota bacterium]|tara:strand:- start:2676 stop:3002 length:327 start_codon:yes stop_codon:yes gene_type:complete